MSITYIIGEKLGNTCVFLGRVPKEGKKPYKANFLCSCGNEFIANISNVKRNYQISCGCKKLYHSQVGQIKHGYAKRGSVNWYYKLWMAIKNRCSKNASPKNLKNYHSRGIKVCDRWLNSFEDFISDMGERPSPKHSIDRIDNNKGYSPENCRWATPTEQNRNRTNTIMAQYKGVIKSFAQICEDLGISYQKTLSDIKSGRNENNITIQI